ncbi:LysR family transcriptional regulator [Williamsia herbipolensis]|uniref:LysR family transcriptional regulator n=1 Tax=Williamsia herbipolensis TaxID=1603258 RepID=UPI0005F842C0|nr:LysR family transcriptional regulator [Williamsia herbipolensis]
MELRQLQYLVAVAEESNFTRAADRCHVAQPAVSAQIARLERELGRPLFDRSRRVVRLTDAGQAALPHARAALAAVADVAAAVDEVGAVIRGTLRIGTVASHDVDLASLLADFHDEHPAVEISLSTDDSDALIAGLRDGRIDLAIASIAVDDTPSSLAVETITDQAIVAAVSIGHPLAAHESVGLDELVGLPLIALPRGTGLRRQFDSACAAAGVSVRIAFEAGTPPALTDLAARELGVAIVPESLARARQDVVCVELRPQIRARLVWAWRGDGRVDPATGAFLQSARRPDTRRGH